MFFRSFRLFERISLHNDMLLAAGIAFYALLALFPAFTVFVSLYGLFFDPYLVARQVEQVAGLIPMEARALLLDGLTTLVTKEKATLNFGLILGLGVSLWSARAGTASMMSSLNIAYETKESRGIVTYIGVSLALTSRHADLHRFRVNRYRCGSARLGSFSVRA